MAVDDKDREAYETAKNLNVVQQALDIATLGIFSHAGLSESESAAYDKGFKGEQLDGDKKED